MANKNKLNSKKKTDFFFLMGKLNFIKAKETVTFCPTYRHSLSD